MESIHIVGGLKAEPSEIQYLLSANGTSVEINVGDIYPDSDENEEEMSEGMKDSMSEQSVSNMEGVIIADACEDKMETRRQIFNYVGYTNEEKTKKNNLKEQETYIFNYTRNGDLFRRKSEMTQENGQLKDESHVESTSDNDVDNEIKSGSQQNKIRNRGTTTVQNNDKRSQLKDESRIESTSDNDVDNEIKSESQQNKIRNGGTTTVQNNDKRSQLEDESCIESASDNDVDNEIKSESRQNKIRNGSTTTVPNSDKKSEQQIYLAEAVFKDDLSYKEYHQTRGLCRCLHCGRKDTLQNIKNHIIARHRKTETKQCPSCNVKTKVLSYHIRLYHKRLYWSLECKKIPQNSSELEIIQSTSGNEVNNEINSDSEENGHSVDTTIMNHSTTTAHNNEKRSNEQVHLAEAVFKDKSPECSELLSDNDVNNEINSDSGQNDHSVDTIMNKSTTTVHKNEKRSSKFTNLAEAEFKDDISWKEYRDSKGGYMCKHCRHEDTLENIKKHIIAKHRKTETKQCPFCDVKTKVLTYHIRVYHKNKSPEGIESTSDNNHFNLAEAVYKDDISWKEYRDSKGGYMCKHCRHEDTLENIKKHIIAKHRKTETKQCPFCDVKTKVLTYHIRVYHKNKSPEGIESTSDSNHFNLAEAVYKDDISWKEYRDSNGGYMCKHCRHEDTLENIKIHIIKKHKRTEMKQCHFCNEKTKVLAYHMRMYHKNMHKCPECKHIAKTSYKLTVHINEKHRVNVSKCDKCDKTFTSKHHLNAHDLRQHRNLRRYDCTHCDFSTKYRYSFMDHLKRHNDPQGLPTLLCDQCDYRTQSKTCFYQHRSKHNNTKFVCDQCGHRTNTAFHLKLHIISHKKQPDADDLRHHCDQCDYKTHRIYSLQVHKLNHLKPEEIEYFYCYHCNFKAKRKDNLKAHIWKLHFKKETFILKCSICAFTTTEKHLLVKHVNKHSKNVQPAVLKSRSSMRVITNLVTPDFPIQTLLES